MDAGVSAKTLDRPVKWTEDRREGYLATIHGRDLVEDVEVAAKRDGVDVYVSATKLFLAPGILVNGTLRATKANQNGLLGFGSSDRGGYRLEPELSVALLLRKNLALGAEYRFKPNNLAFAGSAFIEDDWKDLFIAWAPTKNISVTAAYVDLGNIVGHTRQTGGYLSVQLAY